jgi:hypothetical protein
MARITTAYYTLVVERIGPSGPQNEREIEKMVERWTKELSKGAVDVHIDQHHYSTRTETLEV